MVKKPITKEIILFFCLLTCKDIINNEVSTIYNCSAPYAVV